MRKTVFERLKCKKPINMYNQRESNTESQTLEFHSVWIGQTYIFCLCSCLLAPLEVGSENNNSIWHIYKYNGSEVGIVFTRSLL